MKRASSLAILAATAIACVSHEPLGPQPIEPWEPREELAERAEVEPEADLGIESLVPISPDDAALLAVEHNPELRAARQQRGIAKAQIVAAGMIANPRIDSNIAAPIGGPDAVVMAVGAGLSWNISPLVARRARIQAASAGLDAVDLEVAWQEWQIAQVARLHAVRLIYFERRLALAQELEVAWAAQSKALDAALANSSVTMVDATAVRVAFADAARARLELEDLRTREAITLAESIGLDPNTDIEVDLTWKTELPAVDEIDALVEELPRRRLDLVALQKVHHSHDLGVRAAALAGFPPMEIGVNVQRDADQVAVAGVSLGLEIPSFDRNQGEVALQRANRHAVEAEYEARLMLAEAQVSRVVAQITATEATLAAAENVSAVSRELAEAAAVAVQQGAMSSVAALDLERRANQDRAFVLELEQSLAELEVALTSAAGQ